MLLPLVPSIMPLLGMSALLLLGWCQYQRMSEALSEALKRAGIEPTFYPQQPPPAAAPAAPVRATVYRTAAPHDEDAPAVHARRMRPFFEGCDITKRCPICADCKPNGQTMKFCKDGCDLGLDEPHSHAWCDTCGGAWIVPITTASAVWKEGG